MTENYDPMQDFDYERESKKQKFKELMEGYQYAMEDDAKQREQTILLDEMQKIRNEFGLTPEQEAKIQQALMQNPTLNEKAFRKSVRKRVETILKGLAGGGSIKKKADKSPEAKPVTQNKPTRSQAHAAARERIKQRGYLDADEQMEVIDALLGDMLR